MSKYHTLKVGNESIKYLSKGSGKPLKFLHGFGVEPHDYEPLIDLLAQEYQVISPSFYGVNYLNTQPVTIDDYAELTHDFFIKLNMESSPAVCHSTGTAVGFKISRKIDMIESIVGLSPVLPVHYKALSFILRGVNPMAKDTLPLHSMPRFAINFLKNPKASWKMISDIAEFDVSDFVLDRPALFLCGGKDEYFRMNGNLEEVFKENGIQMKLYPNYGHTWPIHHPEEAMRDITKFLE